MEDHDKLKAEARHKVDAAVKSYDAQAAASVAEAQVIQEHIEEAHRKTQERQNLGRREGSSFLDLGGGKHSAEGPAPVHEHPASHAPHEEHKPKK